MGTKNHPGDFDCYAAALPDEPMFILLARDIKAPSLVRKWAVAYAAEKLMDRERGIEGMTDAQARKHQEAMQCAQAMEEWRLINGSDPEPRLYQPGDPSPDFDGLATPQPHDRKPTRAAQNMRDEIASHRGYEGGSVIFGREFPDAIPYPDATMRPLSEIRKYLCGHSGATAQIGASIVQMAKALWNEIHRLGRLLEKYEARHAEQERSIMDARNERDRLRLQLNNINKRHDGSEYHNSLDTALVERDEAREQRDGLRRELERTNEALTATRDALKRTHYPETKESVEHRLHGSLFDQYVLAVLPTILRSAIEHSKAAHAVGQRAFASDEVMHAECIAIARGLADQAIKARGE